MNDTPEMFGKESAKALRAGATAIEKGIDLASDFGAFLNRAVGKPIEDGIGLLIGDAWAEKGKQNLDALARETERILTQRNLDQSALNGNPAILGPIFDAAQDQSDEQMRRLWATLLANALDPARKNDVRIEIVDTLKRLNPLDALVLTRLSGELNFVSAHELAQHHRGSIDVNAALLASDYLLELGCLQNAPTEQYKFKLSARGATLVRAFMRPRFCSTARQFPRFN